MHVIILMVH